MIKQPLQADGIQKQIEKMTTNTPKQTYSVSRCHHLHLLTCGRSHLRALLVATVCLTALVALIKQAHMIEAASARVNMHQVSRQTNQCKYN